MKIFISWSKPNSNGVAIALKKFIEKVFEGQQQIDFFISSEDIYSGVNWFEKVSLELRSSNLAIICLTKENKFSKWLDFESGAIAFNGQNALVCPFLFNLDSLEESNPLKQYQVTGNNKKDILKLVQQIAHGAGTNLSKGHFTDIFHSNFKRLQNELKRIKQPADTTIESEYFDKFIYPTNVKGVQNGKLFLGTPMASIESLKYQENRGEIIGVITELKKHCSFEQVYSPVENIEDPDKFHGQEKAMELDFAELKRSEFYVFIYHEKVASSILVEIGYAIALMKKTIIFVHDRKDLPFMLEQSDKRNMHIKIYEYPDFNALKKRIEKEGKSMFNFD